MKIERVDDILICQCSSLEHFVVFTYWEDDEEVYVSVHLPRQRIWRRLWYGIKYIFGHQSKYGAFDEVILQHDDWKKLQRVVDHLKRKYDEEEVAQELEKE